MKARKVRKLDPEGPFGRQIRRVVRVRAKELRSFAPRALDPAERDALHDMRIAAKRLRYALELAEPCFGEEARMRSRRARALQDAIGEVHDCDVLLPLTAHEPRLAEAVRERRERLFAAFLDTWGTIEGYDWQMPRSR